METFDIIDSETGEIIHLKNFNEFIPLMAKEQYQIVPPPEGIERKPNEVYVRKLHAQKEK